MTTIPDGRVVTPRQRGVQGAGYGFAVTHENVELVKRCLAARGEGTYLEAVAVDDQEVGANE